MIHKASSQTEAHVELIQELHKEFAVQIGATWERDYNFELDAIRAMIDFPTNVTYVDMTRRAMASVHIVDAKKYCEFAQWFPRGGGANIPVFKVLLEDSAFDSRLDYVLGGAFELGTSDKGQSVSNTLARWFNGRRKRTVASRLDEKALWRPEAKVGHLRESLGGIRT